MIPKNKKTYEQLEAEVNQSKASSMLDNAGKVLQTFIKYSAFVGIAYFAWQSIHDLSGKKTEADVKVHAAASLNPENFNENCAQNPEWPYWIAALSAILATAGMSYGRSQRSLRKQTIAHLTPYKEKYEKLIDSNRTSCGLLTDGSTNPLDT